MTEEEIKKIKTEQKEYINMFGYENNLNKNIKLYVPELNTYMIFEHYPDFIVEFDQYLEIVEDVWHDEYMVGPGGMFPTVLGRRLFEEIEHVNALMMKELFTRQNQIDAIDRNNYTTDEEFISAVQAVIWTLDMDQIFNFHQ